MLLIDLVGDGDLGGGLLPLRFFSGDKLLVFDGDAPPPPRGGGVVDDDGKGDGAGGGFLESPPPPPPLLLLEGDVLLIDGMNVILSWA